MKIFFKIILLSTLLTGCAISDFGRDPRLNGVSGIEYEGGGTREILKSYQIKLDGQVSTEKIKICISREMSNDDVVLTDASSSFYGSYSKKYYNLEKQRVSNGGEVINSTASSSNVVVANGSAFYFFDSGIINVERVVRFTLDVIPSLSGSQYTFSNIKQAQKNTGSLSNDGFSRVGTWEGAGPFQIIQELNKIAININKCAIL